MCALIHNIFLFLQIGEVPSLQYRCQEARDCINFVYIVSKLPAHSIQECCCPVPASTSKMLGECITLNCWDGFRDIVFFSIGLGISKCRFSSQALTSCMNLSNSWKISRSLLLSLSLFVKKFLYMLQQQKPLTQNFRMSTNI